MNEENSGPRFKAGDIVQEGGHGCGMVVADAVNLKTDGGITFQTQWYVNGWKMDSHVTWYISRETLNLLDLTGDAQTQNFTRKLPRLRSSL